MTPTPTQGEVMSEREDWQCARCGQSFDHAIEAPHALEVTFQKLNRLVCEACHQASFQAELKRREGLAP
jgi:ribosomal protein S27AE